MDVALVPVVVDHAGLVQLLQDIPAEDGKTGVLKPAEQVSLWNITSLGEQQHQRLLLPRHAGAEQRFLSSCAHTHATSRSMRLSTTAVASSIERVWRRRTPLASVVCFRLLFISC
jgi:hypothetical protein